MKGTGAGERGWVVSRDGVVKTELTMQASHRTGSGRCEDSILRVTVRAGTLCWECAAYLKNSKWAKVIKLL